MAELWNIRKLCDYFGKSRQTIRRWTREKKLPAPIRKLGTPYWDAEEVKKMLKV